MTVPDALFQDPRLASLYDAFDDDRSDLDLYVDIARDLGARRVADLGCGTGVLALRLADLGLDVTAIDPALAMLDVAHGKHGADRVRWIHGDASALANDSFDLVTMTGNTAQAILDEDWPVTMAAVHDALAAGGFFVFESRVPGRRAWEAWTPELTQQRRDVLGTGFVETWTEVIDMSGPLVSIRHTYVFPDGSELTSDSTLEFRTLEQLTDLLNAAGFEVASLQDAPDRPGLEHVITAQRRSPGAVERADAASSRLLESRWDTQRGGGMMLGMTVKAKIAVTLDPDRVEAARLAVEAGRFASVSAYVDEAMLRMEQNRTLEDDIAETLALTGGPMTDEERAQIDREFGLCRD